MTTILNKATSGSATETATIDRRPVDAAAYRGEMNRVLGTPSKKPSYEQMVSAIRSGTNKEATHERRSKLAQGDTSHSGLVLSDEFLELLIQKGWYRSFVAEWKISMAEITSLITETKRAMKTDPSVSVRSEAQYNAQKYAAMANLMLEARAAGKRAIKLAEG